MVCCASDLKPLLPAVYGAVIRVAHPCNATLIKGSLIVSHLLRMPVVLVSIFLLAACGQSDDTAPRPRPPEGAVAGDFAVNSCVHVANEIEYVAECGTLIVPENRYDDQSRLIDRYRRPALWGHENQVGV